MQQYKDLLKDILKNGVEKTDRTGTGTLSIFGRQMRFDLNKGFPLVTIKKTHFDSIVHELLWFLKGDTNIKYLNDNGVHIWDEWADDNGNLGNIYGAQWRNWRTYYGGHVDQIKNVIHSIITNPDSRRHIVSAWNVADIDLMVLPPCHTMFQFYVVNGKLSCHLNQRSGDCAIGIPYNIASYALLTHMIAQVCGLNVGEFIHTTGDAHIYLNHLEGVETMLQREPFQLPKLYLNYNIHDVDDFKCSDFMLTKYYSHPFIKFPIAV